MKSMQINSFGIDDFHAADWHADISGRRFGYVTNFRYDLRFSVGFLPHDFETDGLSPDDFIAEAVHFPAWGEIPGDAELARLCRIAAYLFAIRFIARLERQMAHGFQHRPISEDSAHDLETNIHVA
jgi:hypothetical protein